MMVPPKDYHVLFYLDFFNRASTNIKFIKGFAEDLPFENDFFGTTILSHTLEHVFDERKTLEEAVRVTKRGGKLIVILPTDLGNDPTHLRYIPSQDILDRLKVYGNVSEEKKIGKGIGYVCEIM